MGRTRARIAPAVVPPARGSRAEERELPLRGRAGRAAAGRRPASASASRSAIEQERVGPERRPGSRPRRVRGSPPRGRAGRPSRRCAPTWMAPVASGIEREALPLEPGLEHRFDVGPGRPAHEERQAAPGRRSPPRTASRSRPGPIHWSKAACSRSDHSGQVASPASVSRVLREQLHEPEQRLRVARAPLPRARRRSGSAPRPRPRAPRLGVGAQRRSSSGRGRRRSRRRG